MPQRRLLLLDSNQLTAYSWQGGLVRSEARFAAGAEGASAFAAYVANHASSIFYLLADVVEEGYQFESVPFVRGADRRAVVSRKLSQLFYGSPLAAALSQGRETQGRRDERMLFAALTRPQSFEPWLSALRAAQARLAGLYSVPLVSTALVRKIAPHLERCLLVSVGRSGIRQSYFDGGRLRFARLSPAAGSSIHELATAANIESVKLQQYLVGQRLCSHGVALPVLILVHPAQRAAFAERCRSNEDVSFEFIDLHAASRACGLKSELNDSGSERLFLHLMVGKTPREQFAPPAERRFFRLWQARTALVGVGIGVLACSVLVAGKHTYEVLRLRDDTAIALSQAQLDARRYAEMMSALPDMPSSLEHLRTVIGRYEALERRTATLEPLLSRISRAMADAPNVDIERLDWLLSSNADDSVELQDLRRANAASGAGPAASEMFGIAVIHGVLASAPVDQRSVLEAINAFASLLRRDPDLRVTVVRLPFDLEPGKLLRGGDSDGAPKREPSRFVIRVSHRL